MPIGLTNVCTKVVDGLIGMGIGGHFDAQYVLNLADGDQKATYVEAQAMPNNPFRYSILYIVCKGDSLTDLRY